MQSIYQPSVTLIATVVLSNIGGCVTTVGDPSVTLVVNTQAIRDSCIGFNEILLFMVPETVVMFIASLFVIQSTGKSSRCLNRNH